MRWLKRSRGCNDLAMPSEGLFLCFSRDCGTFLACSISTATLGKTDARYLLRDLQSLPKIQHPARGWTLAHAFFVNMGGFRIPVRDIADDWPSLIVLNGESFVKILQGQ
jgi:hypothetical protein